MPYRLKFSHKILLAASLVVVLTFMLLTLYNDFLQRNAIRGSLESYLHEIGESTSGNIQNWMSGRILLVENAFARLKHYRAITFRQAQTKLRECGSHGLRVLMVAHVKPQQTLQWVWPPLESILRSRDAVLSASPEPTGERYWVVPCCLNRSGY